jgi:uncharacterized LabA/DUF88 family protein
MGKINFLIDGFNLYHSLDEASYDLGGAATKWLNIRSLLESYLYLISKDAVLNNIYYFTAIAYYRGQPNVNKHKSYINCLKDTGVICEENRFKKKEIKCESCGHVNMRHEEKETDVAIAAKLIEIYMRNECESAVIVSGDTDLVPMVKLTKDIYPGKTTYFLFPYKRKNKELGKLVDGRYFKISNSQYAKHQFPDPYKIKGGKEIPKPSTW